QRGLYLADEAELLLVLEDVERQRDRRDDPEIVVRGELIGLIHPFEALLRRPDPVEVQGKHEPLNIHCRSGSGLEEPRGPGFAVRRSVSGVSWFSVLVPGFSRFCRFSGQVLGARTRTDQELRTKTPNPGPRRSQSIDHGFGMKSCSYRLIA